MVEKSLGVYDDTLPDFENAEAWAAKGRARSITGLFVDNAEHTRLYQPQDRGQYPDYFMLRGMMGCWQASPVNLFRGVTAELAEAELHIRGLPVTAESPELLAELLDEARLLTAMQGRLARQGNRHNRDLVSRVGKYAAENRLWAAIDVLVPGQEPGGTETERSLARVRGVVPKDPDGRTADVVPVFSGRNRRLGKLSVGKVGMVYTEDLE